MSERRNLGVHAAEYGAVFTLAMGTSSSVESAGDLDQVQRCGIFGARK